MSESKIRTRLRLVGADEDGSHAAGAGRPDGRTTLVRAPERPGVVARRGASVGGSGGGGGATGAMPVGWWTRRQEAAEEAVRRENAAAAALTATDARWVLALRVAEAIDGGRAAVLTPEKRRRLVATAERMGLRAFDASLVIAIVQDAARTGELAERGLGSEVAGRLALVPAAGTRGAGESGSVEAVEEKRRESVWGTAIPIAAAVALALLFVRALVVWLLG